MGLLTAERRRAAKESRKLLKATHLVVHISSVATAVEALEELLIERGILKPDELLERVKILAQKKALMDTSGDGD